jgi:alpha-ketoglutarate-dependent taurine dioxygenase
MDAKQQKPSLKRTGTAVTRKHLSVSQEDLVRTECLSTGQPLPLVIKPAMEGVSLVDWTRRNLPFIEKNLLDHGAILFRGFKVQTVAEFERLIMTVSAELLDYSYRSTPRTQVSGKIFTSTEYPAYQTIPLHNEMSYSLNWPLKIWFFSIKTAEQGGETPIADSRRVFERIDPMIREQFSRKQIMYVRNYGDGLDLTWQDVFQTTSKQEVEEFCRGAQIEFEWIGVNRLRTSQICQAIATHPKTGQTVWFNQAHLFNISGLPPEVRQSLLSAFEERDLPRNTYYGDGSPIETSALDEIREAYQQEAIIFPWQEGDIMMLDNMLTAHGRMPYTGARKVVVGMAEASQAVSA